MLSSASRLLLRRSLGPSPLASRSSSTYYSRPLLSHLLSSCPRLLPPADPEAYEPLLDTADKFTADHGHLDAILDAEEPTFHPPAASSPAGVRLSPSCHSLVSSYIAAGFHCMDVSLSLPHAVSTAVSAATMSAFTGGALGHSVLTSCAALLLDVHGSAELKERYHAKLVSGEYLGTMALSEPAAGSSLATNVRTSAVARPDGAYDITGDKMWTSGADHDLGEHTE
ncbi:hypothetical protein TeGR_g3542 [Tetraparma gracilis]|jgi:butyryl-CoA dehydrogenase|uniref:Uncharacterized protein n=1 Tax=Tetraparma gracilis TaxID=2962635 RepID=A0ABQ6MN36_9STRA|nr:hypothetical protein TeGR_g3542 [Tetraparma gracilis]